MMNEKEAAEEKAAQAKDEAEGDESLRHTPKPLIVPNIAYQAGKAWAKQGGRAIKRHWEHR